MEQLVFLRRFRELNKEYQMQTMHIEKKKHPTEKTPTDEIKKILLIDHNKDSALLAALAQERYDVIHCDAVQKAWCLVYPQRPHLIIILLDNLDGAGFADFQECRALAEGVPIILATSAEVNETLMKVLRHRAAAILDFPLMPETIRETLHDFGGALATTR
jgi:DNA-binding NtrC family response regulator